VDLDGLDLMRLTAYRLRRIRQLYKYQAGYMLEGEVEQACADLYARTDCVTGGWLTHAKRLVQAVQRASKDRGAPVCVLVSAGQIVPTLAKLILFQLHEIFPSENVYSSRRDGKLKCFETIAQRFGPGSRFVAIGDGREERQAARTLHWPFIPIELDLGNEDSLFNLTPKKVVQKLEASSGW
jgi:hypothetical protein